jgi:hypothetical protein
MLVNVYAMLALDPVSTGNLGPNCWAKEIILIFIDWPDRENKNKILDINT